MPKLFSDGITVTAAIATRIQAVSGAGSVEEAETWIKGLVKDAVVSYETKVADEAEQAKVDAAETARQEAVQAARDKADSEVTL
jgi:hypothetical protein